VGVVHAYQLSGGGSRSRVLASSSSGSNPSRLCKNHQFMTDSQAGVAERIADQTTCERKGTTCSGGARLTSSLPVTARSNESFHENEERVVAHLALRNGAHGPRYRARFSRSAYTTRSRLMFFGYLFEVYIIHSRQSSCLKHYAVKFRVDRSLFRFQRPDRSAISSEIAVIVRSFALSALLRVVVSGRQSSTCR